MAAGEVTIQFLGAAGTVTGSKYLLTYEGRSILIDCGLFQGLKNLRLQNWEPLPFPPEKIEAVLLTHAHIDHSGYIPKLVKDGFRGKVYCTEPTAALAQIMLPDTGYLQEEEADYLNRKKLSKHHPALPLFSRLDAENALKSFVSRPFDEEFEPVPGFRCRFLYAGHILGAASLIVRAGEKTIGFSGDVGRLQDPVFFPPDPLPPLNCLIVESTYGDRLHPKKDPIIELENVVRANFAKKGVMLVPAFTVGRAQTMLYFLSRLKREGRIPNIPVYLNSPMASRATEAFLKYRALHKLSKQDCEDLLRGVTIIENPEESKALNLKSGPMIIISASGMATGGRILHHLKTFAPDPNNCIALTGFQAAGTRGEALLKGVPEIKIHGQMVPVRAQVINLENLSAHADCSEIISWLAQMKNDPRKVIVTHGEPEAAQSLKERLVERFKWNCILPAYGQVVKVE